MKTVITISLASILLLGVGGCVGTVGSGYHGGYSYGNYPYYYSSPYALSFSYRYLQGGDHRRYDHRRYDHLSHSSFRADRNKPFRDQPAIRSHGDRRHPHQSERAIRRPDPDRRSSFSNIRRHENRFDRSGDRARPAFSTRQEHRSQRAGQGLTVDRGRERGESRDARQLRGRSGMSCSGGRC